MDYGCDQDFAGTAVDESPLYGLNNTDGTAQAVNIPSNIELSADHQVLELEVER